MAQALELGRQLGLGREKLADGGRVCRSVGIGQRHDPLIEEVIEALKLLGPVEVVPMAGVEENIEFRLPVELRV